MAPRPPIKTTARVRCAAAHSDACRARLQTAPRVRSFRRAGPLGGPAPTPRLLLLWLRRDARTAPRDCTFTVVLACVFAWPLSRVSETRVSCEASRAAAHCGCSCCCWRCRYCSGFCPQRARARACRVLVDRARETGSGSASPRYRYSRGDGVAVLVRTVPLRSRARAWRSRRGHASQAGPRTRPRGEDGEREREAPWAWPTRELHLYSLCTAVGRGFQASTHHSCK